MNILYINHYAGAPKYGMEYRPYYMSREWVDLGHSVTILASSFSHVRSSQPTVVGDRTVENIDGIDYIWYKGPSYTSNGFGRVKNILSFLFSVWKDRDYLVNKIKPDVIIASSTYPMDIWIAKSIAKKSGAKLIFEVHDLWPLSPIELGRMSPYHPFIIWCQWAENTAYKVSDAVVSMLPNVHQHMQNHGLELSKLYIIPNGIAEEDWESDSIQPLSNDNLNNFLKEARNAGKIIVGYAGSHGKPNALKFLLDAAKEIKNSNILFVLVGSGLEKDRLVEKKNLENIDNVFFFDPIPKREIPSFLSKIDIAYIGWNRAPIYRFGISPNKILDYMMAEKPIIHSVEASNDLVEIAQCGISVKAENVTSIAGGILSLATLSDEDRKVIGKNGREFVLKEQTYKVLAKKFLEVMK